MGGTFEFRFDPKTRRDPTGWQDWVAFGWIASVTCIQIIFVLLIIVKRHYAPVRLKSTPNLLALMLFGQVHMWATFVANDHFWFWTFARHADCALWSYWLQYFVGLNGWLLVLVARLWNHGYVFARRLRAMSYRMRIALHWVAYAAIALPLAVLCAAVSYYDADAVDGDLGTCHVSFAWRAMLMVWMVIASCVVATVASYVDQDMRRSHKGHFRPLKHVVYAGVFVIASCASIALTGMLPNVWFRLAFTSVVGAFHAFVPVRLVGYRVYKALRGDVDYAASASRGPMSFDVKYQSIRELAVAGGQKLDAFFDYCCAQDPIDYKSSHGTLASRLHPGHAVDLYKNILIWRKNWDEGSPYDDMHQLFEIIYETHLATTATQFVCAVPRKESKKCNKVKSSAGLSRTTFDGVERFVVAAFDLYWGGDYLDILNRDAGASSSFALDREDTALRTANSSAASLPGFVEFANLPMIDDSDTSMDFEMMERQTRMSRHPPSRTPPHRLSPKPKKKHRRLADEEVGEEEEDDLVATTTTSRRDGADV